MGADFGRQEVDVVWFFRIAFDEPDEGVDGGAMAVNGGRNGCGRGVALGVLDALEVGCNAQEHFFGVGGFDDVVDGAGSQAFESVVLVVGGSEEDDGDVAGVFVGLEQAAGNEAVHDGHAHVHEDELGTQHGGPVAGFFAVVGDDEAVVGRFEYGDDDADLFEGVVADEDARTLDGAGGVLWHGCCGYWQLDQVQATRWPLWMGREARNQRQPSSSMDRGMQRARLLVREALMSSAF